MILNEIMLKEIPEPLLRLINPEGEVKAYLKNGVRINEIFIFKGMFRVNTSKGQFRYSVDSNTCIDIY